MARAVACFVVCGLPPSPTPESGPVSGFIGAGATYVPAVLSSYPALPPEGASPASSGNNAGARAFPATPASPADPPRDRLPWPADLPAMCLPEGVDVHVSAPDRDALAPRSYPLVVVSESEDDDADASSPSSPPRAAASDLGASVTHVACVSFLEPVPEATAALNPTLRSAFARKCLCLVSRPERRPRGDPAIASAATLATLAAALEAIRRRCFHPHRARDAAPLADVVAAIVDGLPAPRPGAPATLFTACGRPLCLPPGAKNPEDGDDDAFDAEETLVGGALGTVASESMTRSSESSSNKESSTSNGIELSESFQSVVPRWAPRGLAFPFAYEALLGFLDARHAVRLVCAVATERRVLLVSRDPARRVAAATALVAAVAPMRWRHAFAPSLPRLADAESLRARLASPAPFLFGLAPDALEKALARGAPGAGAATTTPGDRDRDRDRGGVAAGLLGDLAIADLDANEVRGRDLDPPKSACFAALELRLRCVAGAGREGAAEVVAANDGPRSDDVDFDGGGRRRRRSGDGRSGKDRSGDGGSHAAFAALRHLSPRGGFSRRDDGFSSSSSSSSFSSSSDEERDGYDSSSSVASRPRSFAVSLRAARRVAARGGRWSPAHDAAARSAFATCWRRCFRGYRAFLRDPTRGGPEGDGAARGHGTPGNGNRTGTGTGTIAKGSSHQGRDAWFDAEGFRAFVAEEEERRRARRARRGASAEASSSAAGRGSKSSAAGRKATTTNASSGGGASAFASFVARVARTSAFAARARAQGATARRAGDRARALRGGRPGTSAAAAGAAASPRWSSAETRRDPGAEPVRGETGETGLG